MARILHFIFIAAANEFALTTEPPTWVFSMLSPCIFFSAVLWTTFCKIVNLSSGMMRKMAATKGQWKEKGIFVDRIFENACLSIQMAQ